MGAWASWGGSEVRGRSRGGTLYVILKELIETCLKDYSDTGHIPHTFPLAHYFQNVRCVENKNTSLQYCFEHSRIKMRRLSAGK